MKQVANPQNYDFAFHPGELNYLPSQTIPDQSLTVKEVIERYTRGIPFEQGKTPLYMDEEDSEEMDLMPDLKKLDLAEIEELREAVRNEIEEHRKKHNEKVLAARKKKHEETVEQEVKRRMDVLAYQKRQKLNSDTTDETSVS